MGLFRYIVQGFGWQIGSHVAREGIEALEKVPGESPEPEPATRRQAARIARAQRKAAERERARRHAAIEDQLRELKKQARKN